MSALIGDVTPQPQQEDQTWDAARTAATPVPRKSVWVDRSIRRPMCTPNGELRLTDPATSSVNR
ncbi:hypothetical protein [Streptomyces sp. HUAS ZL42]|uniref:hypothetical protein n=1 Tax=Streptomyces sp. HUAS ZL42 TaxID=3231715 RepID=UPI00345E4439